MININNILSVWTIRYDIFSIPNIDNLSLCNIDKNTFVYMTDNKMYILVIDKIILVYITYGHFSIHNVDKEVVYMVYIQIFHMK